MKGYSFRSLTDLVLKIFKTKVNAGTGLSGGGSLEADRTLTVKYGTAAGTATQGNDSRVVNAASNATVNAKEAALETKKADKAITITAGIGLSGGGNLSANRTLDVSYGTAAGTAAQGNDNRLSNSREWIGATISQAEAEAGTATTRRAFTAQRVRQAIVAWFNDISGALGRTILARTTAAQVRSDIGLGTAATRNVGTASGNVMEVGAFGLGGVHRHDSAYPVATTQTGFSTFTDPTDPALPAYGMSVVFGSRYTPDTPAHSNWLGQLYSDTFHPPTLRFRSSINGADWGQPVILHHTGNILHTTGQSTEYPMTQKAVTDALNTKANTSTQVIAGTGLSGGGSLAANRTLSVNYGTTAGTAAQGNDSRIVNSVQTSGNQTIGGTKTFSTFPVTPSSAPTANYQVANKKYVDDKSNLHPSMNGSITLNGTTNNTVVMTDIVTELDLEIGDVIRIDTGAYNKLHTVESITNNGSIIVNYEHAGNRGDSSLKLPNFTGQATVTRIAKWFNASLGLGQAWVDVSAIRSANVIYTNTTGRSIVASVTGWGAGNNDVSLIVDGVLVGVSDTASTGSADSFITATVPREGSYECKVYIGIRGWTELR